MIRVLVSAGSYVAIVFPLAILWHLVLFRAQYQRFGYFEGDPNVPLGLITIMVQGAVLAVLYPWFHSGADRLWRAVQFAGLVGLFFWTSHVLALVGKQQVPDAAQFVLMETGYLILQFGLFALALARIYRAA